MPRHRLFSVAAIAAATLALSACGAGSSSDPYGSVSAPAGSAPAPVAPVAPAPAAVPLLAAKDATALGKIVTDAEGFTLYRFDKDTAKPTPSTTCVDECATKWPPVTVDPKGKLALEGVDKAAVGLVQRPDGSSQLTLGGWPVYRFAGDTEPGATGGQGISGSWFAITPEGKKAAGTGSGAGGSGARGGAADGAGAAGSESGAAGSGSGSSDASEEGAAVGGGY